MDPTVASLRASLLNDDQLAVHIKGFDKLNLGLNLGSNKRIFRVDTDTTRIILSRNYLMTAQALVDHLQSLTEKNPCNLKVLDLRLNEITEKGLEQLVNLIKDTNKFPEFKWLVVWGNPCVSVNNESPLLKKLAKQERKTLEKIVWVQAAHIPGRYWANVLGLNNEDKLLEELADQFLAFYHSYPQVRTSSHRKKMFESIYGKPIEDLWNENFYLINRLVLKQAPEVAQFCKLFEWAKKNKAMTHNFALELAFRCCSGVTFSKSTGYASLWAQIAQLGSGPAARKLHQRLSRRVSDSDDDDYNANDSNADDSYADDSDAHDSEASISDGDAHAQGNQPASASTTHWASELADWLMLHKKKFDKEGDIDKIEEAAVSDPEGVR